jgi:uncharacterized protein GlcG (DUF336 family)
MNPSLSRDERMSALNLSTALCLAQAALAEGRKLGLAPLTVAVLDAGGHLITLLRDDGSSLLRPQIAIGKAWGVLGMGFGGRELARRAGTMPAAFFNALIELSHGQMVPVPGGVLIRDALGQVIGSVGVTGDTSDNDETAALAGIAAAGLKGDTGAA